VLLQTLTSNPRFSASSLDTSAAALNDTLDDLGFAGLWRSCSFNLAQEQQDRTCFGLTEKLIEVSFLFSYFWVFFFFDLLGVGCWGKEGGGERGWYRCLVMALLRG
jgi:neurofibromin 1